MNLEHVEERISFCDLQFANNNIPSHCFPGVVYVTRNKHVFWPYFKERTFILINELINSFNKHFLSIYSGPGTVLGAGYYSTVITFYL